MLYVRRLLPLLAYMLCIVVATQVLDVLGCPDENRAQHQTDHTSDMGGLDADCLCHITYVSETGLAGFSGALMEWEVVGGYRDAMARTGAQRRVERPPMG